MVSKQKNTTSRRQVQRGSKKNLVKKKPGPSKPNCQKWTREQEPEGGTQKDISLEGGSGKGTPKGTHKKDGERKGQKIGGRERTERLLKDRQLKRSAERRSEMKQV